MRELVTHGRAISHQVKAPGLVRGEVNLSNCWTGPAPPLEKLLDALWRCPPYSLMDKRAGVTHFGGAVFPSLPQRSAEAGFACSGIFLTLSGGCFSIPLGIQHFAVAARYFEEGYLRRLKKRTETYFAMAAHDCFNSEWFWSMMRDLPVPDIEPFTITPELRSSYVFARHPKQEKGNRICEPVFLLTMS